MSIFIWGVLVGGQKEADSFVALDTLHLVVGVFIFPGLIRDVLSKVNLTLVQKVSKTM